MKRQITSAGKFAGSMLLAAFFAVLLITSCSDDDEMVNPATNTVTPAMNSDAMEGRITEPGPANPGSIESIFYPYMPEGSMIYIAHGACNGSCPVYAFSVTAKGMVTFTGYRYVGTMGRKTYSVGPAVAENLAQRMVSAGFLNLSNQYPYLVDASMIVTGLNTGRGEPKIILDYGYKVPSALEGLRQEIEIALGVDKLVRIQPGAAESPFDRSQGL